MQKRGSFAQTLPLGGSGNQTNLCLVVEVLDQAIRMVVLLLVKRSKESEVGPVSILLITHVVTNPVTSNELIMVQNCCS